MLVLIAVLATLQYRWLGRISDAERERLTTTLSARADAYAKDFDRELALAYMLFQLEPTIAVSTAPAAESLPARLAARHDRWQETARYPKLIRELYVTERAADGAITLQRFNPSTALLEPVEWPASLTAIRGQLGESHEEKTANGTLVVRTIAPALWERGPRARGARRADSARPAQRARQSHRRPPLAEHVDVLHRAAARSAVHRRRDAARARGASLQRHRRRSAVSARRCRDRQVRGGLSIGRRLLAAAGGQGRRQRRAVPGEAAGVSTARRGRAAFRRARGTSRVVECGAVADHVQGAARTQCHDRRPPARRDCGRRGRSPGGPAGSAAAVGDRWTEQRRSAIDR